VKIEKIDHPQVTEGIGKGEEVEMTKMKAGLDIVIVINTIIKLV
jgi:hypothetical protein